MEAKLIVVVSERPMFREGLKRLIEEAGLATVITAPDEESAESLAVEVAPDIVVIDRPDTRVDDLTYFSLGQDKPAKVVVLGWNDDKLAVYSCRLVLTATLQNLIKAISGC